MGAGGSGSMGMVGAAANIKSSALRTAAICTSFGFVSQHSRYAACSAWAAEAAGGSHRWKRAKRQHMITRSWWVCMGVLEGPLNKASMNVLLDVWCWCRRLVAWELRLVQVDMLRHPHSPLAHQHTSPWPLQT